MIEGHLVRYENLLHLGPDDEEASSQRADEFTGPQQVIFGLVRELVLRRHVESLERLYEGEHLLHSDLNEFKGRAHRIFATTSGPARDLTHSSAADRA